MSKPAGLGRNSQKSDLFLMCHIRWLWSWVWKKLNRQLETLWAQHIRQPCVVVVQGGLAPVGVQLSARMSSGVYMYIMYNFICKLCIFVYVNYVYLYVYICEYMWIYVYHFIIYISCMYVCILCMYMYVCMYIMYVYACICMYMYVYVYVNSIHKCAMQWNIRMAPVEVQLIGKLE